MAALADLALLLLPAAAVLGGAAAYQRRQQRHIRELEHRLLQAERLLRLRSNLANEIAHEIKNPVSAILCSAETLDLLLGEQLQPEHRQALRYIRDYGSSLLRLVSDFLDISVAESGNLKAVPESIEAIPLVRAVIGLLESTAQRKGTNLRLIAPEEGLYLLADPSHLKQIVFNLVHNAVKFTPAGGEIRVLVASDFPSPRARIMVQDNGIGIPAGEQPYLFDLYRRSEKRELLRHDGVGLGLALCKSLVELSGGSISLESKEGVGSSFTLYLPLDQGKRGGLKSPQPLQGKHYLLVRGEEQHNQQTAEQITAMGGIVDLVNDGAKALQALETTAYTAVLIDYQADGGYGCELARVIKEDFSPANTRIIVAAAQPEQQDQAHAAGAEALLLDSDPAEALWQLLRS